MRSIACERCGARLWPLEGSVCAGCGRLLCRRHYRGRVWRGVLSRAGGGLLCDRCQAPTPRGRTRGIPILGGLLPLVLPLAGGRAQEGKPPLRPARVAGEVVTGALGTPVGFVAGGLLTRWTASRLGASEDAASRVAWAGAWTGAALATAAGPTIVGTRGRVTGSYGAAVLGAVAGGAGSYLLVRLNTRPDDQGESCRLVCAVSTVGVFLLPSIGATVGFNMSRRYER